MFRCLVAIGLFFPTVLFSQLSQSYQLPPKEILDLIDIQPTPMVRVASSGQYAVLLQRSSFKTLDELAAEELRLAGLRINPKNFGPSRTNYFYGIQVLNLVTGQKTVVGNIPSNAHLSNLSFSPDEKHIAFTNSTENDIALYVVELSSGKATKITNGNLNAVMGSPYFWTADSKGLLCKTMSDGYKGKIWTLQLPEGPVVQVAAGKKAPARTFQDLLRNKRDEDLFDHMAGSEITFVGLDGSRKSVLPQGIYLNIEPSPDGAYYLVTTMQRPYSYIVQYDRFPMSTKIYAADGKLVQDFHLKPLLEELPNGFDAVEKGKREISWREDRPATIFWVEAQDEGDPAVDVKYRDKIFQLDAPFNGTPKYMVSTVNRFSGIRWGNEKMALVTDNWWKNRNTKTYLIDPSVSNEKPKVLFDLSSEDMYADPGNFLTYKNAKGQQVLRFSKDGKRLFLTGQGYSPEGNKPFLAEYDIATGKRKIRWQADGKSTYENIYHVIDPEKNVLLTSIESPTLNPNFYVRTGAKAQPKKVTDFPDPYSTFKGVTKQRISYKRKDGVDLSATIYLPKGYDKTKDGTLPVIMWAYPREFKDKSQAGQVKESPHRFVQMNYGSPVYWVMRGYAVMDNCDFPIVGEGENEPNDSFIEQLVANAEAAIKTIAEMGIGDRKRVAIGGHSYGAFMTANLMAHCDLFAAGIARSGAYNRTLTPFGFQSEERTFWEAKKVYMEMSPFYFAEKINEPLLMIHGDADNNPGTFTMQSERLFSAIKGLGGTARLVLLPYESHGYSARENVLHMLWEQDQWLEEHVKNKK